MLEITKFEFYATIVASIFITISLCIPVGTLCVRAVRRTHALGDGLLENGGAV